MLANCLRFYFSMDLDNQSRLKNVFCEDNKSQQAYKDFGDVVTVDSIYLTNRNDISFVPFVGVNHHGQLTLLGCSLVLNEHTDTLYGYLGHDCNACTVKLPIRWFSIRSGTRIMQFRSCLQIRSIDGVCGI